MANQPQSFLRFNHREIAVVFSLFVFTALLMFTVGVLVGKGLAQPRVEWSSDKGDLNGMVAEKTQQTVGSDEEVTGTGTESANSPVMAQPTLIPPPAPAKELPAAEKNSAFKSSWFKSDVIPNLPRWVADGKFTVQVGSYSNREDAEERVEALKKLGFAGAYTTTKEIGEKRETWYRVWLGNYSDLDSAQRSGQALQDRGEVRNYLVRKTVSVD